MTSIGQDAHPLDSIRLSFGRVCQHLLRESVFSEATYTSSESGIYWSGRALGNRLRESVDKKCLILVERNREKVYLNTTFCSWFIEQVKVCDCPYTEGLRAFLCS